MLQEELWDEVFLLLHLFQHLGEDPSPFFAPSAVTETDPLLSKTFTCISNGTMLSKISAFYDEAFWAESYS